MRRGLFSLQGTVLLLAGCAGPQSALDPQGSAAIAIDRLNGIMTVGGALILLLVLALTAYALLAAPETRGWLGSRRTILWGGIAFPTVTVTALLIYGLLVARGIVTPAVGEDVQRVEVVGEQFWWRVRYLDDDGRVLFETANELHLPVGRTVELALTSADVIHSFWVPALAGKLDMIPGRTNILRLRAERAGVYRGQCTEFCGVQHARMAFHAVALEAEAYDAWLREASGPAVEPATSGLREGRERFLQLGCGACHAVRGTGAAGVLGPDLTRIGSRQSLGAGMMPVTAENLAAWIADSQHLKPGNLMPPFDMLPDGEAQAIARYLESLK
ncbi:cytochrome c oxidase subunit II [Oceanibaculum pacificum]|uniref:Cytochrome aa3 subunit 2 n=1 Tax=Oceanibaculum pacificum TaxID=580166 RepID=A0A154VI35_9PROT|nr:cytochrome c oxidase subunit II [Oceanibaculum pacificum]KZD01003.1 hypothetical protein AUP43_14155 [Oceanibaculum pacificum]